MSVVGLEFGGGLSLSGEPIDDRGRRRLEDFRLHRTEETLVLTPLIGWISVGRNQRRRIAVAIIVVETVLLEILSRVIPR